MLLYIKYFSRGTTSREEPLLERNHFSMLNLSREELLLCIKYLIHGRELVDANEPAALGVVLSLCNPTLFHPETVSG